MSSFFFFGVECFECWTVVGGGVWGGVEVKAEFVSLAETAGKEKERRTSPTFKGKLLCVIVTWFTPSPV